MTPDRLQEIRQRLEKITPGQWEALEMTHFGEPGTGFWSVQPITEPDETMTHGDAEFIAHAPEDITDLLAALATAEAEGRRQAELEIRGQCDATLPAECGMGTVYCRLVRGHSGHHDGSNNEGTRIAAWGM